MPPESGTGWSMPSTLLCLLDPAKGRQPPWPRTLGLDTGGQWQRYARGGNTAKWLVGKQTYQQVPNVNATCGIMWHHADISHSANPLLAEGRAWSAASTAAGLRKGFSPEARRMQLLPALHVLAGAEMLPPPPLQPPLLPLVAATPPLSLLPGIASTAACLGAQQALGPPSLPPPPDLQPSAMPARRNSHSCRALCTASSL